MKKLSILFSFFVCLSAAVTLACPPPPPRGDCVEQSELGWNPPKEFITPRLRRFYDLEEQIEPRMTAKDFAGAEPLIAEYLSLAATYHCNWHFGDAIHDGNRFRGLILLERGDVDAAAAALIRAGDNSGSPELETFGPELDLARLLLERGKTSEVATYLREAKCFWKSGGDLIDQWLEKLGRNEIPQLDRYAAADPSWLETMLRALVLAWPALVSLGLVLGYSRRIRRKGLAALFTVTAAYLSSVAATRLEMQLWSWILTVCNPMTSLISPLVLTTALFWGLLPTVVAALCVRPFLASAPVENETPLHMPS